MIFTYQWAFQEPEAFSPFSGISPSLMPSTSLKMLQTLMILRRGWVLLMDSAFDVGIVWRGGCEEVRKSRSSMCFPCILCLALKGTCCKKEVWSGGALTFVHIFTDTPRDTKELLLKSWWSIIQICGCKFLQTPGKKTKTTKKQYSMKSDSTF